MAIGESRSVTLLKLLDHVNLRLLKAFKCMCLIELLLMAKKTYSLPVNNFAATPCTLAQLLPAD